MKLLVSKVKNLRGSLVGMLAVAFLAAGTAGKAQAFGPTIGDALGANGFGTLAFALDVTDLVPVLESNLVTVFAPTDDVFEATAEALGCTDALDLATRLIGVPVGDSNALAEILTYHASLGVIRGSNQLIKNGDLSMVNGGVVETGVNANGLYVKGAGNATGSTITSTEIRGFFWRIYPIDQILLPFAPPADLCL